MEVNVIGAGLAGCEASWYLANKGHKVKLFEQRPINSTPAHKTDKFASLFVQIHFVRMNLLQVLVY